MPVVDAREELGSRTIPVVVIFSTSEPYVSAFSYPEYVFNCDKVMFFLGSVVVESLLGLTLTPVPRFPNPIPNGTYVPFWALVIPVRF